MNHRRIENLDALRACAILMVVVFHSTQVFSASIPVVWLFTRAGFFGVDLFFALSGFLIGSLFFEERNANGIVAIPRFILRRISRTVPPYFIALILSYLAVYMYRQEPFNFGYLFFLQNYYTEIPFFLISWSLCVEEHFYFVLPIVLSIFFAVFKRPAFSFAIVLFLLSLVPLLLRLQYQEIQPKPFGFYVTATHLKFDPLILGVLFAYISIYFETALRYLLRFKMAIYLFCCLLLLSYSWWPAKWMYSIGSYVLGAAFATTVAVACFDKSWSISKHKIIFLIAVASYAIYLTHALTLHVMERLLDVVEINNVFLQLTIMIVIACFVGYLFYLIIEKPLMKWRKKRIPSYRTINRERMNVGSVS